MLNLVYIILHTYIIFIRINVSSVNQFVCSYFDEATPRILPQFPFLLREDSIWISRSFLLSFRERRKSNVGGRTERLKGGVNGSISAVSRQQNTKWNSNGKTYAAARISRISRAGKSDRIFRKRVSPNNKSLRIMIAVALEHKNS